MFLPDGGRRTFNIERKQVIMSLLKPSAVLYLTKPSIQRENYRPEGLWVIEKSSVYEKISTAVRRVNEKPVRT
jgi:hypothetical protein